MSWTDFAGEYDEFKVVGLRVTVGFPSEGKLAASGSTLVDYPNVAVFYYDNDNSTSVATIPLAYDYASAVASPADGVVSYTLPSLPEASMYTGGLSGNDISSEWCDCANPTAVQGGIGLQLDHVLSGGPTALKTCATLVEYDVIFKGRR